MSESVPIRRDRRVWSRWVGLAAFLLLGAALWKWTPLHHYLSRAALEGISDRISATPAPVLTVVVGYVLASLILFPVIAMIGLGALALPPAQAIVAGFIGVLASSCTGYFLGWMLGPVRVERFLGPLYQTAEKESR